MAVEIKSPAKLEMFKFVKTDYDEDYVFEVDGGEAVAQAFVRNMRVELSRLRRLAEENGRTPVPFKMRVVSLEEFQNQNGGSPVKTRVTLRRTKSMATEITEEISSVLNNISLDLEENGEKEGVKANGN